MKQIPQPLLKTNKKSRLFDISEPQIQTLESVSKHIPESHDIRIGQLISGNVVPTSNMNGVQAELIKNVRIPLSWKIAAPPDGSVELINTLLAGTRRNIICSLIEKQTRIVKSILSSEPAHESPEVDSGGRTSLNEKYLKRLAAATDLLDSLTDLLALQDHAINLRRRLAEQTSAKDKHPGCAKTAA